MKRSMCVFAVVAGLLAAGTLQAAADVTFGVSGAPTLLEGTAGQVVPFTANVTITTANNNGGLEWGLKGWSLSLAAENCEIKTITVGDDPTTEDTEGLLLKTLWDHDGDEALKPPPPVFTPKRASDFIMNLDTNPFTVAGLAESVPPGIKGAVEAVALSVSAKTRVLTPEGTQIVALITAEATIPATGCALARLYFLDGLKGAGEPVPNTCTFPDGASVTPAFQNAEINLCFAVPPEKSNFSRGDTNGDTKTDIADAINIIFCFVVPGAVSGRDFVPIACRDSADIDKSGAVNIQDAILIINWQFLDGPPPPEPFPACGTTTESNASTCPAGSTGC